MTEEANKGEMVRWRIGGKIANRFGREEKFEIVDGRMERPRIQLNTHPKDLLIGKSAMLSAHGDDSSLDAGGLLLGYRDVGGRVHLVTAFSGYRTPVGKERRKEKIRERRLEEIAKEATALKGERHFLDLEKTYENKKIDPSDEGRFYSALDGIDPTTICVHNESDGNIDHQNLRRLALNWAASRVNKGKPVVIVERDSMWGTLDARHITHAVSLPHKIWAGKKRLQGIFKSQTRRTDFIKTAMERAKAYAPIVSEVRHGLVRKTPKIPPQEVYSQLILHNKDGRLVLEYLTPELKCKYKFGAVGRPVKYKARKEGTKRRRK
jgi:LmbE family N-acetylglucosaminyl deacetylase